MPRKREAPEKAYQSFEVIDFSTPAGQQQVLELLQPQVAKGYAAYSVLDHMLGPGGQADPLTRTIVVENSYVDRDYARAHQSFFDRAFLDVPRKTTRLHFFGSAFTKRSLPSIGKYSDDYLGFAVARPLRVRKVGRTVVPLAADPTQPAFITTLSSTEVNIAGYSFQAIGPPFMEQDERVSRCATAALWMTTSALANHVGLHRFTTAEITAFGTRYMVEGRELPSSGLYPQQMAEALRAMGYEAIKLGVPRDINEAKALAYSYVESGVPPMLILVTPDSAHVVTAVGHLWTPSLVTPPVFSRMWTHDPALEFHHSSSWVPALLAHDDETGPFVSVFFDSSTAELEAKYGPGPTAQVMQMGGVPVTVEKNLRFAGQVVRYPAVLAQILVPNPPGVVLTGPEAELKAARLIKAWYLAHHIAPPANFVLRTYLARSNDFKRWVRESDMHQVARQIYAGKGMPRWLWVTEISEIPWMNEADDKMRLIRGEVVIDPTSSPWVPDFLTFHLIEPQINNDAGLLATMVPRDEDAEDAMALAIKLPGESPYTHLGRHVGG